MWETTLKKISDATAKQAVLKWCDQPKKIQLIANAINCVYRFESENVGYYLRITHEKIRSLNQLESAIDFQCYLFDKKVPICKPVKSLNSIFIESVKQDHLIFMTHVCKEVPGEEIHFHYKNFEIYFNWGKALAKLHEASSHYHPSPGMFFLSWKELQNELDKYIASENFDIQEIYQNIKQRLADQKINELNFGLIHGDMREANVICDSHSVHFIDFDEPVYHWWTQDIARAFLNIASKKTTLWKEPYLHFIAGYRSQKQLTDEQLAQIPWLIKNKMMDIYLWTKNNWRDSNAPGGGSTQKWLEELQRNLLCHEIEEKFDAIYS